MFKQLGTSLEEKTIGQHPPRGARSPLLSPLSWQPSPAEAGHQVVLTPETTSLTTHRHARYPAHLNGRIPHHPSQEGVLSW